VAVVADAAHGPELLVWWLALSRLGAVFVPVNPALTAAERTRVVGHAQPGFVIAERPAGWAGDATRLAPDRLAAATLPCDAPPPVPIDPGDPVAVLYTSGSTGAAKGCVLSHEAYTVPAPGFVERIGVRADDRLLGCLPLFHMAGQSFAVSALQAAAELAIVPRFSASSFWPQVASTGATVFRYLGEMLSLLVRQPVAVAERGHRLRLVYGGGARPDVAARFARRFGVPVVHGYGLSETNTVLAGDPTVRTAGELGPPLPHTTVRITDPAGATVPPGAVGEIRVRRGPATLLGYHRDPARTAAVFDGDWLRTGDLGRMHPDGSVSFVARRGDVIRCRGEQVDPREVEEVLSTHPDIATAVVLGVPVGPAEDQIHAFVVPAAGARPRPDEVRAWCGRMLAPFKLPTGVSVVDRVPMTSTTKVDRPALMARLRGDSR
jgi:acyl-CoA synthetase (AMP-forming)/AMP-acid ligase II